MATTRITVLVRISICGYVYMWMYVCMYMLCKNEYQHTYVYVHIYLWGNIRFAVRPNGIPCGCWRNIKCIFATSSHYNDNQNAIVAIKMSIKPSSFDIHKTVKQVKRTGSQQKLHDDQLSTNQRNSLHISLRLGAYILIHTHTHRHTHRHSHRHARKGCQRCSFMAFYAKGPPLSFWIYLLIMCNLNVTY